MIPTDSEMISGMYDRLIVQIRDFLSTDENAGIESLILGVSGGLDSALVAELVQMALYGDRDLDIKLLGYSLPIHTNEEDEILRASQVGLAFCHEFHTANLYAQYESMLGAIVGRGIRDKILDREHVPVEYLIRAGNLKARLRMMYLYDKAKEHNGLVLSTDNYTEYCLGFWTLHGDVGDFGPIQSLWKTEVYEMTDYVAKGFGTISKATILRECIDAIPTDGLGITDSDMDQLYPTWHKEINTGQDSLEKSVGWRSYEYIDSILKNWMSGSHGDRSHPVSKRVLATNFKRNNPYNIPRHLITEPY